MSVVIAAAAATELAPATRDWLTAATAYARFAGPDGDGTRIADRGGVGHALLKLPHEHADQPLTLTDGAWFSADARLDDRGALRATLRSAGQVVSAEADDSELLARGYAVWRERCLERASGDFAFAVWDERRGELFCACDQLGVVPLHYTTLGDQLLVASSPELLLLHPDVSAALDEEAVGEFLLMGQSNRFGATTFAAIRRLPAAHVLRWSDGTLQLRRYWELPEFEPLLRLPRSEDYVERFRELLERAVADRAHAGRVSSHLSGGMDSSTVTAVAHRVLAAEATPGELLAITLVLGEATGDEEGHYAGLIADSLGIPQVLIDESKLDATDPLRPPKLLTPEPTPYPWSDLEYQRILVAAEHGRTCLTGLGADPLLGFVPGYWLEWLSARRFGRLATTYWDQARLFRERPRPYLRTALRQSLIQRRMPSPAVPSWLNDSFAVSVDAPGRLRALAVPPSWARDKRSLSRSPAWQAWFTLGDPCYTRLPVRFRHPMVDLRLLDFVARIAPYPWLVRKRILRDAAVGLLPQSVRERPKSLLIDAPRTSNTPDTRRALADLVANVPAAGRFLDTESLRETVLSDETTTWRDWALSKPLGLVYWLAYWDRPQADMRTVLGRNAY